jgi:hypothetical protein
MYERPEQGIPIVPALFRNFELSIGGLIISLSLSCAKKEHIEGKNSRFSIRNNFVAFLWTPPSTVLCPSHLHLPDLKRESQESLRIPLRLS